MTLEHTREAVPAADELYAERALSPASGGPRQGLHGPGLLPQALEARALLEHLAAFALRPLWRAAPAGDGHPVLALPGLAAGDASTAILRRFLRSRGFAAVGWGQGQPRGPQGRHRARPRDAPRLAQEQGRKVSLVGSSLVGLYARELAKLSPDVVRRVVTLGSPFVGRPRETNAWRLCELASGHRVGHRGFHAPLRTPPPVPTTSIWSLTDGIVSWRCSVETRSERAENIVVESSHMGLAAHPATLFAIADRLGQLEGHWTPFHRRGWRGLRLRGPGEGGWGSQRPGGEHTVAAAQKILSSRKAACAGSARC